MKLCDLHVMADVRKDKTTVSSQHAVSQLDRERDRVCFAIRRYHISLTYPHNKTIFFNYDTLLNIVSL